MKLKLLTCLMACALGVNTFGVDKHAAPFSSGHYQRQQRGAKICFNPNVRCRTSATFEAYDLPFQLSESTVIYETEMFYAVILKSVRATAEDCNIFIPEEERLEAQSLFPDRKVFASRCAEPTSLYYTNVDANHRFMAVFAGYTQAEAARMLSRVKATGKYPGANIRRMRAGFNGT